MTDSEAIEIAMKARPKWEVEDTFQPGSAERQIIEFVEGAPVDALPDAGPVRDVVAWVVLLTFEESWAEFAVAEQGGEIVRFRRSR